MSENFLRKVPHRFYKQLSKSCEKLPYPTHILTVGEDTCEEYEIPVECMQKVLNSVNPVEPSIHYDIEDEMLDMMERKTFKAKEFKIIWHDNCNVIVSPWFAKSGSDDMMCINHTHP